MANEEIKADGGMLPTVMESNAINMPALRQKMQQMLELKSLMDDFLKNILHEGIFNDYATIPGTKEISLLKPGAEKIQQFFGFYNDTFCVAEKEDWEIPLFAYTYRTVVKQKGTNIIIASYEADASSRESRFAIEWKYESQIPPEYKKEKLPQKAFGYGEKETVKYAVPVFNIADQRNNIRSRAIKRSFVNAVKLASMTSDLFRGQDPDDYDGTGGGSPKQSDGPHKPASTSGDKAQESPAAGLPKKQWGEPINDKQAKRLYAIRKNNQIGDPEFKAWLKKYWGYNRDTEIGKEIYDVIVGMVQTGRLEIPAHIDEQKDKAEPPAAGEKPYAGAGPLPEDKIGAEQINKLSLMIHKSKQTQKQFEKWLVEYDQKFEGLGLNDITFGDLADIKEAWLRCDKEGTLNL